MPVDLMQQAILRRAGGCQTFIAASTLLGAGACQMPGPTYYPTIGPSPR